MGVGSGGPVLSGAGVALAGAFALALASPAQALDLNGGEAVKDETGASAAADWAGFYMGGQTAGSWPGVGLGLAQSDPAPALGPDEVVRNPIWHGAGLTSNSRVGYNWGDRQIVYGVEGDMSFGEHADYLAAIRGRIGLVSDSWLFYGTGGAAYSTIGHSGPPAPESATLNFDLGEGQAGFVAGAGVEAKLSSDVSIGVEGLYYGFDAGGRPEKGAAITSGPESLSDVTVIRGRLTLRLDGEPEPLK